MTGRDYTFINRPELLSVQVLAYIGDAVYELAVREYLVSLGFAKMDKLHKEAVQYVRASTQAEVLHIIEDYLSEEELAVVRRGRNTKINHCPKGAEVIEYRYSTAFESLIGYLYFKGAHERLGELINLVFSKFKKKVNSESKK
ncbi:ribonuclease III domain-containing protein [Desulfolucanica intricata]|uniref:Mini-ribonuclease 3 n=1 Tax=Desulfolucanica intricata TaxID=1285191 RepID=UPI00082A9E74